MDNQHTLLTFIIPVRHPLNSRDWSKLYTNLSQTITSISAQSNPSWQAVVVANTGANLPHLPQKFHVVHVDFPPNPSHDREPTDQKKEFFYDAFRFDKGRRVLKGMLAYSDTDYYMIVDDDDFISSHLVEFVSRNKSENGWRINQGYIWSEGGRLLYAHRDFSNICGTSHIVRSDLYNLPKNFDDASSDFIKNMLGSHIKIESILESKGTPLLNLPFEGAIYRVGHVNAHSKSKGIIGMYVLNLKLIRHPFIWIKNVFSLRMLSNDIKNDFFGKLK